ncbi:myosin heavy chain, striated muscle-like isoform X2 [Corythoichthys intestinalis]|uniref:myosin heavy chain, striated muscle-like isoform X2 n=1 Tax=Corythoichthys intestinalis TaxID=161448 RepID=UPI0025A63985|nr:myosin heavy chain, striated muscle-like isoform X2 [Corythoichthys intestinalis]
MTGEEVERVWRERLQRCQRQLKAKEDEMRRQSEYFEKFKCQLHHKLSLARDREESLQKRIYTLEKQLLDMTVSAATNIAALNAVRIAPRSETHREEHGRLPGAREEGEGEEEKNEGNTSQWQPNNGGESNGRLKVNKGIAENKWSTDNKLTSNEVRLQGFILTLQEDLRVLLDREERGVTEHRRLIEQLQEAQENNLFLCCKVEEMKVELQQLNLSESALIKEVEELRVENTRVQHDIKDSTKQISDQSSAITANGCPSETDPTVHHPEEDSEKASDEQDAVPIFHHQAAEGSPNCAIRDFSFTAKHGPQHSSKKDTRIIYPFLNLQPLSLVSEIKEWGSTGGLNVEDSHSAESEALREAYRSLGLGEDLKGLREQCDHLEAALQHSKQQLQMMAQENAQLKLQLSNQGEEMQESLLHKLTPTSTIYEADVCQLPPMEDDVTAPDGLLHALNNENRALALHLQELLAHIEHSEKEMTSERSQLREDILCLKEDKAKLEQEKTEQACLVTELTRKTEDDLNTIMELQQKLEEHVDCNKLKNVACGSLLQTKDTILELERCQENNSEKFLGSGIEGVTTKQEQIRLISTSLPEDKTTYLKPVDSPPSHLDVKSLSDQAEQLTKSIRSLKAEQQQLYGYLVPLQKKQKELSLSVQAQKEEKQHLTRTIWALKDERDGVSRSLDGLKHEREQIIRVVSGLKDVQVRLSKSVSSLKVQKEKFTECFPALEREKEKLFESLSSGKEEVRQIALTVQKLENEKGHLGQAVLSLKLERDKLTDSHPESTDRNQACDHLQADYDHLLKSFNTLKEQKERTEHSVRSLKHEESQIMSLLQSQRGKNCGQQTDPQSQTPENTADDWLSAKIKATEENNQNMTGNFTGNSIQEQSDLVRKLEAVQRELNESQEELDRRRAESIALHGQLSQSEARRENAEKLSIQAADELKKLRDFANQAEETLKENRCLTTQVKQLESKVSVLIQDKSTALTLKSQIEDQRNLLTAQLKAKTVALEELNSEYITLKKERDGKDELSTLISLRARYNNIRAKQTRSKTDVDIVPLKAKLSCLVVKCQERNSLLARMMKVMREHSVVDFTLTQRADELLRDAALLEYSAAFAPASCEDSQDCEPSPGFLSKFHNYTSSHTLNDSDKEQTSAKPFFLGASTTNVPDCNRDAICSPIERRTQNANSPVPIVKEDNRVPLSSEPGKDVPSPEQTNMPPSSTEQEQRSHLDIRPESCPSPFNVYDMNRSFKSPVPLLSRAHVSPNRRLSSPEKIINLQEQLQHTLLSGCEAVVGKERIKSRRTSFSAPASPNPSSHKKQQGFGFIAPPNGLYPLSTLPSTTELPLPMMKTPVSRSRPATLFNAVTAKCANMSFTPHLLANNCFKATVSQTSSAPNSLISTAASSKTNSTLRHDCNVPMSLKSKRQISSDVATAEHSASSPLMTSKSTDSSVLVCSDTNLKSTASDTTALTKATASKTEVFSSVIKPNGAAPSACDGLEFWTIKSHFTQHSAEESSNNTKFHIPEEEIRTRRPEPDAPAEVNCVEVIKQVGQSSLLIGWERPTLDQLGCSNGTYVYGYRVFLDGEFYKSVMSSACTKCVLENVDLTSPVEIGVETLGSNGLSSKCVQTIYMSPVVTGHL